MYRLNLFLSLPSLVYRHTVCPINGTPILVNLDNRLSVLAVNHFHDGIAVYIYLLLLNLFLFVEVDK